MSCSRPMSQLICLNLSSTVIFSIPFNFCKCNVVSFHLFLPELDIVGHLCVPIEFILLRSVSQTLRLKKGKNIFTAAENSGTFLKTLQIFSILFFYSIDGMMKFSESQRLVDWTVLENTSIRVSINHLEACVCRHLNI